MAKVSSGPTREFSRAELTKELVHDYSTSSTGVVPLDERRSRYHFIALWVTLAAGFTYLFLGFQYHDAGYPLGKAVGAGALGAVAYLAYALPASLRQFSPYVRALEPLRQEARRPERS